MNKQQENTSIEKTVIEIIAQRLGTPATNVTKGSFLYDDLNAGKLEIADIIQTLEDKFDIKFDIEAIKTFQTVADLIEYLIDNVD